jgi:hypothetical protein
VPIRGSARVGATMAPPRSQRRGGVAANNFSLDNISATGG